MFVCLGRIVWYFLEINCSREPVTMACIFSQSFATACSGASTDFFGSHSRFFSLSPKVFSHYSFRAGPINWDVVKNGYGSFNRVRWNSCVGLTGGGGDGGVCRQQGLRVFTCLASINGVPSTSGKKKKKKKKFFFMFLISILSYLSIWCGCTGESWEFYICLLFYGLFHWIK